MPISQHAPKIAVAMFDTVLSALLVALETSSAMAPDSRASSPLLILSTMTNASCIAVTTRTDKAITAESIKAKLRRYCFKNMCPAPGNTRPDRSAAFIGRLISNSLARGHLLGRPLSAAVSTDRRWHMTDRRCGSRSRRPPGQGHRWRSLRR